MEKVNITLNIEDYKLDALEYALKKDGSSVQRRMEDALNELYETAVPAEVRDYVESRNAPAKPKRPPRPAPAKTQPATTTAKEENSDGVKGNNPVAG